MDKPSRIPKAAAGGALAIALAAVAILEGYGPEVRPGVYRSYTDIAGVLTICNGRTGPDVKPDQLATKAICDDMARADIIEAFAAEDAEIPSVEKVPERVRAAVALFILNVGKGGFQSSTVLKRINEGRYTDACNALMMWTKARINGQLRVVAGLVNRRSAERKICLEGIL
jgi:lysozyme